MPCTFKVSSVISEPFSKEGLRFTQFPDLPHDHYLNDCFEYKSEKCGQILAESVWRPEISKPSQNGFVYAVLTAYNNHHKLVLRPDDVWFGITTQFSAYVNGNAESLRDVFVSHRGQKKLEVNLNHTDYARFAYRMGQELKKHIKDPAVIDWILPKFSTTTQTDTIVGSVIAMCTLKKYFMYTFYSMCGIPEVTLLGTPADWKSLHEKVRFLRKFGPTCNKWADKLALVTENLYKSSTGAVDVGFWQSVCSERRRNGSGSSYLNGWITAFCAFDDKGTWQLDDSSRGIPTSAIPVGYATTPVTLIAADGSVSASFMFAGHMAIKNTRRSPEDAIDKTSIAPHTSWAIVQSEGSGEDTPVKNVYSH